jgi:peptide/nickel transport system permease protein
MTATVIAFCLGCLLGMIGAWRRSGAFDSVMPPLLIFVGSFPYFWLATVALYFVSFEWDLLPRRHAFSDDLHKDWLDPAFLVSVGHHLILPAATVVLVSLGGWLLGMRNTMIAVLAEDYITMAQAKGLKQRRIMFFYAARNALLPNITAFGMALGFVISGALVTEIVFAYPGLGYQLLQAVQNLDYPLMQGIFLMITLAVLAANLVVDLLYLRLDPRVRNS